MIQGNFNNKSSRNRLSLWLYVFSLIFGVWGLWMHNVVAILIALVLFALSQIFSSRRKKLAAAPMVDSGSGFFGQGVEALVSRPKAVAPKSLVNSEANSEIEAEPEVYNFEEEMKIGEKLETRNW